ncbi:response regulator [Thermosulfuriphilus sp.]
MLRVGQKRLLRKDAGGEDRRFLPEERAQKKVLIVDDSEMVRNFHSYILRDAGFEVKGAADGAEALEMFLAEPFDLIITDINMPRMDGLTFIRRVREIDASIPIIIVSTEDEATDKQQGYDAGANFYLVKPTRPEILIENVRFLTE